MSKVSNLVKNLGAGSWARVSNIGFKLLQVPLLLAFLSPEDYGRWLILYSLPSWLSYASQGFGSVAANEIPMRIAAGDADGARRVYATSVVFLLAIAVGGMAVVGAIVPWVPWSGFLSVAPERHSEMVWAALWLAASLFLSFIGELFSGRYRAAQRAHGGIMVASFHPWAELLFMLIAFQFTRRFDYLALAVLLATVSYLVVYAWLSKRAYPSLTLKWANVDRTAFRQLFRQGFAFQAFPLGNALLFQGNLLVVQLVLGPAAVALFGTARTLVRVLNQALELVSKSIWPELSYQYGAGDLAGMRKLHRLGVGLCAFLAVGGVLGLSLVGGHLYEFWVGSSLALPFYLLVLFLLPIPFNALWLTSSTVLLASNRHERLARRYLVATFTAALACLVLTYAFGIGGAAVSTVVADLILIPYVASQALALTQDTWPQFIKGSLQELRNGAGQIAAKLNLT